MYCIYEAQTMPLPIADLAVEPPTSSDRLALHEDNSGVCLVCRGYRRVRCAQCREGRVPLLEGYITCDACHDLGWKVCPAC